MNACLSCYFKLKIKVWSVLVYYLTKHEWTYDTKIMCGEKKIEDRTAKSILHYIFYVCQFTIVKIQSTLEMFLELKTVKDSV